MNTEKREEHECGVKLVERDFYISSSEKLSLQSMGALIILMENKLLRKKELVVN